VGAAVHGGAGGEGGEEAVEHFLEDGGGHTGVSGGEGDEVTRFPSHGGALGVSPIFIVVDDPLIFEVVRLERIGQIRPRILGRNATWYIMGAHVLKGVGSCPCPCCP